MFQTPLLMCQLSTPTESTLQEHGVRPSWTLLLLDTALGKRCCAMALVASSLCVVPCTVQGVENSPTLRGRGQPCSPSPWQAGHQCAGLGFLDGSCAVPQLCLRGHFLCTQNYCRWSFSAKDPRVTKLGFNLPMTKPLVAKSHPFLHSMSQCFRHQ